MKKCIEKNRYHLLLKEEEKLERSQKKEGIQLGSKNHLGVI